MCVDFNFFSVRIATHWISSTSHAVNPDPRMLLIQLLQVPHFTLLFRVYQHSRHIRSRRGSAVSIMDMLKCRHSDDRELVSFDEMLRFVDSPGACFMDSGLSTAVTMNFLSSCVPCACFNCKGCAYSHKRCFFVCR